jgi:TonB family protein
MKIAAIVVLLTLTIVGICRGQQEQKRELPSSCVKTVLVVGALPNGPFKILPKETYKRSPVLKFQIQEDGTVSDVSITRSSGVVDIDKKLRASAARWKYKPRPAGCGVIENEMSVTIDWGE